MSLRHHLLLLSVAFALALTPIAYGEDSPAPAKSKETPSNDAPSKDEPSKDKPSKEEPSKDKPAEGEKPKPESDDPAKPKDEPNNDKERDADQPRRGNPDPDDDTEVELPPDVEESGHAPGTDPKDLEAERNRKVHVIPGPAGTVRVEAASFKMGTSGLKLKKLLEGRPQTVIEMLIHEKPRHVATVSNYYIQQHEVTNAQYLKFLQDSSLTYNTSEGILRIDDIAAHLLALTDEARKHRTASAWRQLYFTNKDTLWAAMKAIKVDKKVTRLDQLIAKHPDGTIDEDKTAKNFRYEPLPRNVELKFYSKRPPRHWKTWEPDEGRLNHPLRFISYNDFERFAEWAGGHPPTEAEWEYGALGGKDYLFPWGNVWYVDASHCNWGSKIINKRFQVDSSPVDDIDPKNDKDSAKFGMSWCGLYHMAGNVAEFTSSWFYAYPGDKIVNRFMNDTIKVIRGGTAADQEWLVLRGACRNWVGAGSEARPYPDNAFRWVGGRLAFYDEPGRDAIGPILRRASGGGRISKKDLNIKGFAGAVTRNWVQAGAKAENHVYIKGRARSIVFIPVTSYIREEGMQFMEEAYKKPQRYRTDKGIAKNNISERPQWILGVLHTDVSIKDVQVRKPESQLTEAEKKKKERRKRRGRLKKELFATIPGTLAPGTYIVSLWHGRVALTDATMSFKCFIPKPAGQKEAQYKVIKLRKPEEFKATTLGFDPDADEANISFHYPIGGRKDKSHMHLAVEFRLIFPSDELATKGGDWQTHDGAWDDGSDKKDKKSDTKKNASKNASEDDASKNKGATKKKEAAKPDSGKDTKDAPAKDDESDAEPKKTEEPDEAPASK